MVYTRSDSLSLSHLVYPFQFYLCQSSLSVLCLLLQTLVCLWVQPQSELAPSPSVWYVGRPNNLYSDCYNCTENNTEKLNRSWNNRTDVFEKLNNYRFLGFFKRKLVITLFFSFLYCISFGKNKNRFFVKPVFSFSHQKKYFFFFF